VRAVATVELVKLGDKVDLGLLRDIMQKSLQQDYDNFPSALIPMWVRAEV